MYHELRNKLKEMIIEMAVYRTALEKNEVNKINPIRARQFRSIAEGFAESEIVEFEKQILIREIRGIIIDDVSSMLIKRSKHQRIMEIIVAVVMLLISILIAIPTLSPSFSPMPFMMSALVVAVFAAILGLWAILA